MLRNSQRARIRDLQLEQLELEAQLQDLSRFHASPFSLRRASEMIREWVFLNKHIHQLLRASLGRPPRQEPAKKKRAPADGGAARKRRNLPEGPLARS